MPPATDHAGGCTGCAASCKSCPVRGLFYTVPACEHVGKASRWRGWDGVTHRAVAVGGAGDVDSIFIEARVARGRAAPVAFTARRRRGLADAGEVGQPQTHHCARAPGRVDARGVTNLWHDGPCTRYCSMRALLAPCRHPTCNVLGVNLRGSTTVGCGGARLSSRFSLP